MICRQTNKGTHYSRRSKLKHVNGIYNYEGLDFPATNEAIALVKTQGSTLTTHEIAPHVTHRPQVKLALSNLKPNLEEFDYILLNTRHAGWQSDRDYALNLVAQSKRTPSLKLDYQKDDVYLFSKKYL